MKKTLLISIASTVIFAFMYADRLTGRWETKPSVKGNITGVVFKPDNTFEGYINKKPFTSGTYTFTDSVLSFTDNGCLDIKAIYKIQFFSQADSFRFVAISDSCTARRQGMERLVMGKVKANKVVQ